MPLPLDVRASAISDELLLLRLATSVEDLNVVLSQSAKAIRLSRELLLKLMKPPRV
jgi:hypothetical protein